LFNFKLWKHVRHFCYLKRRSTVLFDVFPNNSENLIKRNILCRIQHLNLIKNIIISLFDNKKSLKAFMREEKNKTDIFNDADTLNRLTLKLYDFLCALNFMIITILIRVLLLLWAVTKIILSILKWFLEYKAYGDMWYVLLKLFQQFKSKKFCLATIKSWDVQLEFSSTN
jgi:ABC-type multidrug transport system fused ATPase/permease subunit